MEVDRSVRKYPAHSDNDRRPYLVRSHCYKSRKQQLQHKSTMVNLFITLCIFTFIITVKAWTGEIHGRVVCDVCADGSVGPEDHVLEVCCIGAEVAVLCITKSGEVLNYQAFTNSRGIYTVAETMPESERWDACLARPISSFHEHCTHLGDGFSGVKFSYNHVSGYSHAVKPFVYRPASIPIYCG
ncbi:hypothetical protein HanRHA438_Chr11g0497551 [Helianthus annuus]|nr:hypothetical protein HanHA300_Chr11g0397231 [Helianthus annuus]KAJ0517022.1 hypothetical protein HanHA89_Chr11g0420521 [Helianthus annuus]KAJ0688954.1 hypothetical protein HanOQP8_Chr11g0400121 [Helianthus annuus]KAJ0870188.1 hypothetical protein HanRHA438_Chr11g0497551 [Helianthus annuus]KAJ0874659.1 hypothetical protein HanPSC8_Chr11g0466831 [Helianthus annuus]